MNPALRSTLAIVAIGLMAACASSQGRLPATAEQEAHRDATSRQLVGFEGVYDQARQAGQGHGLELAIEFHAEAAFEDADEPGQALLLRQRDASGNERPFLLYWQLDQQGQPSQAFFAPLNPSDGQALGRCPLMTRLGNTGLQAETQVEECLFGEGASRIALHKEIALDGDQLVIADRVLSAQDSQPIQDDVVLRLFRRSHFELQAVDQSDGGQRLAEPASIDTSGHSVTPSDAAGMSLPFQLQLRYYQLSNNAVVLRLTVLDDQGEAVAEGWGDHESAALGIVTENFEVALQRLR